MGENKYRVIDGEYILADNMSLELALMLIQAYCNKYYMDNVSLTVERCHNEEIKND